MKRISFKSIINWPVLVFLTWASSFVATFSSAKEITVFDIRRPVSLENNQEMPKDFFINAGLEAGLKVGMVVAVNRRQTLYDPFQSKSPGDLVVPVGKLRIIHTQENISVARMVEIMGREQLPGLEFDAIMIGDRLDMSTAKMGQNSNKAMNGNDGVSVVVVEVPVTEKTAETAVAASTATPPVLESSSQSPVPSLPTQGPTL